MLKRIHWTILLAVMVLLIGSTALASSFPITVTDSLGHEVRIEKAPNRIISMTPSLTEILFALDLEDRIVAVTDYCNYPEAVETKDSIGGLDTGLESILAKEPDLVVCTTMNTKETMDRLAELGYPVIVIESNSFEHIFPSISIIGEATGQTREAQALIETMKKEKEELEEKLKHIEGPTLVFYEVWDDPLMSVNKDTFIGELITLAGGLNVTHDAASAYPIVSVETLIDRNPTVYIMPTGHGAIQMSDLDNRLGYDQLDAIIHNRVYVVDQDVVTRPGPRVIEGLKILARILHPQLF